MQTNAEPEEDTMDVLFDISQLLETGLDRETLDILVQLVETGVNPEALASVVKELRREAAALASQSDQVVDDGSNGDRHASDGDENPDALQPAWKF